MKFKSFFASVLAFAAIAIACEPVEGELKEAISDERYERAAQIRDELNSLRGQ